MERSPEEPIGRLRRVKDLWPGKMSEKDLMIWHTLSPDRAEAVLHRVEALAMIAGSSRVDAETLRAARKQAQMAESTFYAMARRWKSKPSLEALGVHATRSRGAPDSDGWTPLHERVLELLSADRGLTIREVLDGLKPSDAHLPSQTSVHRIMRQIAPRLPAKGPFGELIAFDNVGLDLLADENTPLRLCAAFDVNTGLILAVDLQPAAMTSLGYRNVAARASDFLMVDDASGAGSPLALTNYSLERLTFTQEEGRVEARFLPRTADAHLRDLLGRAGGAVIEDPKCGRELVGLLGDSLNTIWIGSGELPAGISYRTGKAVHMPIASPPIQAELVRAVNIHNGVRMRVVAGHPTGDRGAGVVRRIAERMKVIGCQAGER